MCIWFPAFFLLLFFAFELSICLHISQQKAKFPNLFSATVGIKQKDMVDKMVRKVRIKSIYFLHLLPDLVRSSYTWSGDLIFVSHNNAVSVK